MTGRRKIFYVHVPKCGGTSIANALRRAQPLRERFSADRVVAINAAASAASGRRLDKDILSHRCELACYFLSHGRTRLVHGHVPCPPQMLDWFGATTRFITLLRNPVERWISQYLYDRYKESEHYRTRDPIEQYMQSEAARGSGQLCTVYFAERSAALGAAAVAQACATLARFDIVAVLEDLRTLTGPYERIFGRRLRFARERTSPAPAEARRELESPSVRREIERLCALDLEVYAYARDLAKRSLR